MPWRKFNGRYIDEMASGRLTLSELLTLRPN